MQAELMQLLRDFPLVEMKRFVHRCLFVAVCQFKKKEGISFHTTNTERIKRWVQESSPQFNRKMKT